MATTVSTDPYFAAAYNFAVTNWTAAGLKIGGIPNPVLLARLQTMTFNHMRAFRNLGGPKTTTAHLLNAARYGVALASRDLSQNPLDIPQSYAAAVGETVTGAVKDPLAAVSGGLSGLAAIGHLANEFTLLMSGNRHVLLRTVYIVFGGLSLLAGVGILARELGMKPPVDVPKLAPKIVKTVVKGPSPKPKAKAPAPKPKVRKAPRPTPKAKASA